MVEREKKHKNLDNVSKTKIKRLYLMVYIYIYTNHVWKTWIVYYCVANIMMISLYC